MPDGKQDIAAVLDFWFGELVRAQWFKKDQAVDQTIRARFADLYERICGGLSHDWLESAEGCLAAIVVLDQFPRNLFRQSPRAFATDGQALTVAKRAIERGLDRTLGTEQRMILYMPFQHCEDRADQARSVVLFETLGDEQTLDFARQHKDIIDRFGRFPHRNAALGRDTTEEERAFLAETKAAFF